MPRSKKIFFLISLLIIIGLFVLNAKSANPNNQPYYNAKRLYEKTLLALKTNPEKKLDYQLSLLDKRLSELSFIVLNGKSEHILKTSLRYSTTAGQSTEQVINNNLKGRSDGVKQKLESHLKVVDNLVANYPKDDGQKKFVIDASNYLKTYIIQLTTN
ncbi:hypothetical protein A2715_04955 [Candidatus Woesebacteria bacterium RIFCSPHIGHO2_01_FULL_39_32]|uniref:DUF5667 domain-containing protein n=1 Tax=Candidatus Woesebacteria bacterium RIFCSPLOWO2_01_FULL_39_25 TaxID=1802521 RepID=A0A1F8BMK3_9BACT|nr:MAG: hypothetical protein A2124_00760 [Candidatus Woesebacteria bacterium GWB1_37_5]OGM25368.1 MAG: hypothetical protein A2715_04955 [Candidatus Woesebacteria bacterium RIFCSPHIGHO2_01_FULL_39_32]OGM38476.1 MAG: hypothetical protein A3F01_03910 [Candidatus Woesebacteria bacterium RIFCSPHIGHO2_12_FULL_38_11]OGM64899.1 MAG: hypothetical protein A2893_04565 [Candidatus Woesebacteria bacterium RIFCSPLOWO2_01_FULL_39_25]